MIFEASTKRKIFKRLVIFTTVTAVLAITFARSLPAEASSSGIVIGQVQTGASASASQEYVAIYNNSESAVEVTGWCAVYASASGATQTDLSCFLPPDNQTKLMLRSHGSVIFASNEFLQAHPDITADQVFSAGLSGTSGHIKLLGADKSQIDVVGWGAAAFPEGSAVSAHQTGKILQRRNVDDQVLQDTDNNSADFYQTGFAPIQGSGIDEEFTPLNLENAPLIISELLPNAVGTDTGKEFIELFNPLTRPVNIKGYSLQIGPGYAKSHALPDATIGPGEYLALSDVQTGISLPNTTGSLRLLAPSGEVVSTTDAYDSPDDDVAWIYMDGMWQESDRPTPNAVNVPSAVDEATVSAIGAEQTPCRPDQERNPETGRCRKIASTVSAAACKAGQIRNAETGRCRSAISTLASILPCKPGQERNPETKRCRNIASADAAKPCPAGQQRNSETNRCRKVLSACAANPAKVKDVPTGLISNNARWWLAGATAAGSLGYAGFEWRRETLQVLSVIKSKFIPG